MGRIGSEGRRVHIKRAGSDITIDHADGLQY
jgi:hypothetical protein